MLGWVLAAGLVFGVGSAWAAGVLTIAQAQDPNNWDPIATFLVPWGAVASNVFDGLVLRDETLVLKPGLAESWEVLDGGVREGALRKVAGFVADTALELPLYSIDTYYGVNRRVKGLVVPPDNRLRLIGARVD